MNDQFPTRSVRRYRWLSDISASLAEAENLLREIDEGPFGPSETAEIKRRIAALSTEVDKLCHGPINPSEMADWADIPHWSGNRE